MSVEAGGTAQTADSAATSPTPGELLVAGREARGLTLQQVADELRLDVRLVKAIELNNFALLGPPVYARGYLRKYAALLGLPPEVIIAHYETLTGVPGTPLAIPARVAAPPPQRVSLRVPAFIVAGVLMAGMLFWVASWVSSRFEGNTNPTTAQPAPVATLTLPEQTTGTPSTDQPLAPETSGGAAVTPPGVPARAPTTPVVAAADDVRMRLVFSDPSWVEIYDANERRLMYGIGQAGQTRVIAGKAPLRVTLGLASAVTLDVNENPVVVPRRMNRDSARFTVAADGSIR